MAPKIQYDWTELLKKLKEDTLAGKVAPNVHAGAIYLGVPRPSLRDALKRRGVSGANEYKDWLGLEGSEEEPKEGENAFFAKTKEGSYISERLISIMTADMQDESAILKAHGLDPDIWTVISYRHNYWQALRAFDQGQVVNCQSRVSVRPKTEADLSMSDIKKVLTDQYKHVIRKGKRYSTKEQVLEIDIADLHVGRRTLGGDNQPVEKMRAVIDDILERAQGRTFSGIYFVPLGDITDVDNMQGTTTKGTQQNLTMTVYTMLKTAKDIMIEAVTRMLEIAPVKYIFVPGNHDKLLSYAVALAVVEHFYSNKDFSYDLSEDPNKWDTFGLCLLAWSHGEIKRGELSNWLPVKARSVWSKIKFAEVHSGHINPQKVIEAGGQVIRYLPSVTDSSLWEESEGFVQGSNVRCTASFVWDAERGVRDQWFSNV